MRLQTIGSLAGLALALPLVLSRPAVAEEKESFTATVLLTSNMAMPRSGQTYQITINVDEWTSMEDKKNLVTQLKEGGESALLKAAEKMKAGYILPPAWAQQPSWRIAVASTFDSPKGRVVRLFTDRPIAFAEAYRNTRSMDYPFGAAELILNEKGEGEGVIIPAAKVSFDEQGRLVFETLPHSTGPQKLLGVKSWSKEYKKKK